MNRIISINIKGLIFQIEEDAYQELSNYLERIKRHFVSTEGSSEIIDDIESRIAEMLTKSPGVNGCVTLSHVNEIIRVMGNPSDFGDTEEKQEEQPYTYTTKKTRKLFRDPDNRILGGVCSGMGSYFDIDQIWFRIAFLIAFFTFGTGLVVYVILWVIISEAKTAGDRLEMKGEKVTIDNIEKIVTEEFDKIKKKFGEAETGRKAADFARSAGGQIQDVLGNILRIALKLFGLFLILLITFILVMCFLGYLGVLSNNIDLPFFPFFHFLFENDTLAWIFQTSCILLFIIPLLSILYAGILLVTGSKNRVRWIGKILGTLFALSLIGFLSMWVYLAGAWSDNASLNKEQEWTAPDTLYITSGNIELYKQTQFSIDFGPSKGFKGIYGWQGDSLKRPVTLNIHPHSDKKVSLQESRQSNGNSNEQAAELASHIESSYTTQGRSILFNPYFSVPTSDVWRNQKLVYNLYIPVGTVIVFGKNTQVFLNNIESENYIHRNHLEGKSFRMTESGLQATGQDMVSYENYGEIYRFSDFDEVVLTGNNDVEIVSSDTFFVAQTGEPNGHTEIKKEGRRLIIKHTGVDMLSDNNERWLICLPGCKKITSNGRNNIHLGFTHHKELNVELNGTSDLDGMFSGERFNLVSKGVNQVGITGSALQARFEFHGAGNFMGENFITRECRVKIAGGGIARVHATDMLAADADGASKITYYGKPKTKQISSNGISIVEEGE